ncbi:MAG: diguanylate cyclase with sensor [Firmicutes bacterium]|nr:diguanylate cyclase with sensor [Bacillota bacterium]
MDDYYSLFLNNILDYLNEGVYFTDLNQNILYCNSGAECITGYRLEEVVMKNYGDVMMHIALSGEQLREEQYLVEKTRKEGRVQETFMFIYHKDGHKIPVTIRTFPVYDKVGKLVGFIELITDNSRQKLGQDKVNALTQAAYIDSQTELFSKQYLEHRVQTLLAEMPESGKTFGVLYINILGFRTINDSYGVTQGDKVLKQVGQTLAAAITPPSIIGRWHGASFIVVVNDTHKSLLLLLANKLKTRLAETEFAINEEKIPVRIAVGYTLAQALDNFDYLIERVNKSSLEEREEEPPVQVAKESQEDKEPEYSFQQVKESFIHPHPDE